MRVILFDPERSIIEVKLKKKAKNYDFGGAFGPINDSKEKEFMGLIIYGQRHIFSYILTMVPNHSDAEDILQDTMTIMWRKFDEFERGSNFIAWGIAIAKFRIMKYRKSTIVSKLRLDEDVLDLLEKQSGWMLEKMNDHLDALKNCIKKLSDKERNFLKMRYEQDLSFRKIASSVGLTSPAVFKAISQVHCKLMRCIKRTRFIEAGS